VRLRSPARFETPGFVTSAAEAGASILKIQEVSRHKSVDVLSGYVRRVDLFKDHAGAGFL
jgi:hypothetical protein